VKKVAKQRKASSKAKPKTKPAAKKPPARSKAARSATKAKAAKPGAKKPGAKRSAAKKSVAKKSTAKKSTAKKSAAKQPASKAKTDLAKSVASAAKWLRFVAEHGAVLASAHHATVPNLAEAIAGEPIVGSWWSHPKSNLIFDVLSAIDDAPDVRCFKLVDHKVTFVHRDRWPHLVRLARDAVIAPEQAATIEQEHTASGEHHNLVTPFPNWVPTEVDAAADELPLAEARAAFSWL